MQAAPISNRIAALLDKRMRTNKSGVSLNVERTRLYTEYCKAHDNQYPVKKRAGALKYWTENKTVKIEDEDIFVGGMSGDFRCISFYIEWNALWLEACMFDSDENFRAAWQYPGCSYVSDDDREMLKEAVLYWKDKTYNALAEGIMPDEMWGLANNGINGIPKKGGGISSLPIGHFIGNFNKVISTGFGSVKREAQAKLDVMRGKVYGTSAKSFAFYESIVTVCDAAILFAKRHAAACREKAKNASPERSAELLEMADSLDWIMENPARTYWEGLQAMLFYQMLLCADAQQHGQSMGRVDQYAGYLLEKQLEEGTITIERAQELTDAFMLRINDLLRMMPFMSNEQLIPLNKEGRFLVGSLSDAITSSGGIAITIGGVNRDGTDATIHSTYMFVQSLLRLGIADPTTALRIHDNTPDDLWELAIESSKTNGGLPQFQNDNLIIPMLVEIGRTLEDARDYGIVGCAEPACCGKEYPACGGNGNNSGFCNEGNLIMAIHGGVHPITGAKGLPCKKLYEYESFEELKNEFIRQGLYFLDWHITMTNLCETVYAENFPAVVASAMMDGCLDSGKDVTSGGSVYNRQSFCSMGTANVADGLMAIKKLCFDEKRYTLREFYDALCANWEGYEELRQVIRNECPHYGNGDDEIDALASWSLRYYAEHLNEVDSPRGGKYCGGTFTVTTHVYQGFTTPATPDGRFAGTPLADAISPIQGLDTNGPVAYMTSASKLPHKILYNGDQLNIRFSPSVMQGGGSKKIRDLIETYFKLGGMQVQFNVVGTDVLIDAQKNPDEYRSLIVRIAGYSAYFVELRKPVQDDFITRTAQLVQCAKLILLHSNPILQQKGSDIMIDFDKMPPSRQPEGTFPWMMQQPPKPLYPGNRPITAKENLLRIYRGEKPCWIPIWLTDSQYCWPDVYQEHALWEGTGYDWWGQHWTYVPEVAGQMPTPGYRVITDIAKWQEEVKFPDLNAVDWDGDAKIQTSRYDPNRAHLFHVVEGMFERLHELMPMDEAMVAFYEEPEQVHVFFKAMVPYKIEIMDIVFKKYAPIDYIIWGDDWGTQRSGFFSNSMYREFIMPYTKECWDWVHNTGRFIELHSCGLTQQYIDEFVEMGLDAWTPQAINDLDMLTRKYGEKIALTVMQPEIAEAKSEKEARELIRKFVDTYAPRGKVISGPIMNADEKIKNAALEELYNYSSEFYAKR